LMVARRLPGVISMLITGMRLSYNNKRKEYIVSYACYCGEICYEITLFFCRIIKKQRPSLSEVTQMQ
jgi:hypothetical protein